MPPIIDGEFNEAFWKQAPSLTGDGSGEKLYDGTITRLRPAYQVNQYLFFRGIGEYNDFRKNLNTEFLASFTYIPGTVVYLGSGRVVGWDFAGDSLYSRSHTSSVHMKIIKTVLSVLLVIFVIAQFIRPEKITSAPDLSKDISTAVAVPENVSAILRESCYDCHSNETRYPWYFEIQPVGWWLDDHMKDAKRQMNFSEFAGTSLRRQYHKLEEITEQINQDDMPLPPYLIVHRHAALTQKQKDLLNAWVTGSRAFMKNTYPPDSLEKPGRDGEGPPQRRP